VNADEASEAVEGRPSVTAGTPSGSRDMRHNPIRGALIDLAVLALDFIIELCSDWVADLEAEQERLDRMEAS
jgi:hypothetical protein